MRLSAAQYFRGETITRSSPVGTPLPEAAFRVAFGTSGVGSAEDAHLATMTRPNDSQQQHEYVADVLHLTSDAIGVSGVSPRRPDAPEPPS